MKKTRFTESQIISILNQQQGGLKVADICREHGISAGTFPEFLEKPLPFHYQRLPITYGLSILSLSALLLLLLLLFTSLPLKSEKIRPPFEWEYKYFT